MPAAGDHLEGVVKRAEHGAQVFARSLFRAGEVQDEAVSSRAGHGAGKPTAKVIEDELPITRIRPLYQEIFQWIVSLVNQKMAEIPNGEAGQVD